MNEPNKQTDNQLVATLAASVYPSILWMLYKDAALDDTTAREDKEALVITAELAVYVAKTIIAKANATD